MSPLFQIPYGDDTTDYFCSLTCAQIVGGPNRVDMIEQIDAPPQVDHRIYCENPKCRRLLIVPAYQYELEEAVLL